MIWMFWMFWMFWIISVDAFEVLIKQTGSFSCLEYNSLALDTLLNVLSVSCATHSRMKSFSSWYSIWPSSGTGSVSRIFSGSKLLSAHTETHIKHVNHLHVCNSEGIVPVTADGQVGGPTGERVRAEGRVSGEAGGGASQQVWEGRGDGGERRLPPPLQHLRELVLMQRPRETTKFYLFIN